MWGFKASLKWSRNGIRHQHFATTKFGGLDRETFAELATSMTPLIKEFFKPVITKIEVDSFSMALPFKKEFVGNPTIPCQHGGVVAALIDHVGGFCAWSALESSHKRVSTVDLRVDYLLPAPCEELHFDATVISKTKKLIRVDVTCWDSGRIKKLAIGRCLFNIYDGKADMSALIAQARAKENSNEKPVSNIGEN